MRDKDADGWLGAGTKAARVVCEAHYKGFCQMMGAIVLSMLLSWFGAVTVLMILAGRARTATEALEALEAREMHEAAEEPRRTTGGPRLAADDAQGGSAPF